MVVAEKKAAASAIRKALKKYRRDGLFFGFKVIWRVVSVHGHVTDMKFDNAAEVRANIHDRDTMRGPNNGQSPNQNQITILGKCSNGIAH